MPKPSLLADLALRLAPSPEDIATKALTLILGRSEPARQAMNNLIAHWAQRTDCSITRWREQIVGADDSRTDMEGEDDAGVMRVIFENKFWAGLTPNQPKTYLGRLPADYGLLVFVVPAARLTQIEFELIDRASDAGAGRLAFRGVEKSRVAQVLAHALVVTSWDAVLTTIATALEAAQDHTALADIRQLQGLTEKMDREGFLPFTTTDISGPTPRILLQCYQVVDDVGTIVHRWKGRVNKKGLGRNVGPGWYGPNFFLHGYGCNLMFSARHWARLGLSPIWLRVCTPDWRLPQHLHTPLAAILPDPSWLQSEDKGLLVPLRLTEGRELSVVVADVVTQVERIATVLAAHPTIGPATEPPPSSVTAPAMPGSDDHVDTAPGDARGRALSDPVGG